MPCGSCHPVCLDLNHMETRHGLPGWIQLAVQARLQTTRNKRFTTYIGRDRSKLQPTNAGDKAILKNRRLQVFKHSCLETKVLTWPKVRKLWCWTRRISNGNTYVLTSTNFHFPTHPLCRLVLIFPSTKTSSVAVTTWCTRCKFFPAQAQYGDSTYRRAFPRESIIVHLEKMHAGHLWRKSFFELLSRPYPNNYTFSATRGHYAYYFIAFSGLLIVYEWAGILEDVDSCGYYLESYGSFLPRLRSFLCSGVSNAHIVYLAPVHLRTISSWLLLSRARRRLSLSLCMSRRDSISRSKGNSYVCTPLLLLSLFLFCV